MHLCSIHRIRVVWIGRNPKDHLVPNLLPWAGAPSPRPTCSDPHFQGWGFSRQSVPVFYLLTVKSSFLIMCHIPTRAQSSELCDEKVLQVRVECGKTPHLVREDKRIQQSRQQPAAGSLQLSHITTTDFWLPQFKVFRYWDAYSEMLWHQTPGVEPADLQPPQLLPSML